VYIRHGDKHTEHKTYNDSAYEETLVALREIDPSLTNQVFLSTEDPATVTYFTNASRGWSTSYVDMPRKPDRYAVCKGGVGLVGWFYSGWHGEASHVWTRNV
jgi:hypothetical protein